MRNPKTEEREMIDHDAFMGELMAARHERAATLRRGDVLELLIEHVACSEHRMALPPHWSKDEVVVKLREVFTDDPFIARMLDAFELMLAQAPTGSDPRPNA